MPSLATPVKNQIKYCLRLAFLSAALLLLSTPFSAKADFQVAVGNYSYGGGSLFDQSGASVGTLSSSVLGSPTGMAFGPDGNLYVSDYGGSDVARFNGQTGAFMGDFVSQNSGGLVRPYGLTFGPDGNLYVAKSVRKK